jgi:glycogen debranching enzyme
LATAGAGPVTLVEGRTFMVSGTTGDLDDGSRGLFVLDTRVLSRWTLQLDGEPLESLAVDHGAPYAASFAARGRAAPGTSDADIVVFRHRHIGAGLRERLVVTNYGLAAATVELSLACDADFAELFEVKENRVRPDRHRSVHIGPDGLQIEEHTAIGAAKCTIIRPVGASALEPGLIVWRLALAPGDEWETCVEVTVRVDGKELEPQFRCGGDDTVAAPAGRMRHWQARVPEVETDHDVLAQSLRRSREDLGALRIFDDQFPDLPVIAAGAPWFMTLFGRDSLLTAWMALIADASLAHGVLETLARLQGTMEVPDTEEQPGRILHEIRFGRSRDGDLDGGEVYYGSVDATPLFVMLLGELRRWDSADELVDRLLPHADRALEWISGYGDVDGDGFVEYQRRTETGLSNQGWKDSWDAIRHADGQLARPPIALCEVQGYVYAAYIARAHLAAEAGDAAGQERWTACARELYQRFNEQFWVEELGTYALGLDADKRPIATVASNVGHCLWTGIVDPDRAGRVADRLLAPDMFNGWGVRTLAASMAAYNPVSYHNGSVWPHDNALCAAGLSRYGFADHANRIIVGQLDVAAARQGRLPELFAGFDRSELSVPAVYPASCSPQAWASGAPLLWLRTMLRLDPWATRGEVWLRPRLPPTIRRLHVAGIRVGDQRITVDVGERVSVAGAEGLDVVLGRRPSLSRLLDGPHPPSDL